MTTYRFLQPLDVLYLRGNKLFGDAGSFGEGLIPPWPSVAAGALRSQILASEGVDLDAFAAGRVDHPQLGTPQRPGPFRVTDFWLGRQTPGDGIETLHAPPADLVLSGDDPDHPRVARMKPRVLSPGLVCSAPLPQVPVLPDEARRKAISGLWLTQAGWQRYLQGETPSAGQFETSARLWQIDTRVGVGLDPEQRRADDGKLFTVQAIALHEAVGFLVAVAGARPPADGTLRLGGDGRGAAVETVPFAPPEPDFDRIARDRCGRVVLTTPGLFPNGWRLPGADTDGHWRLGDISGRLVCAAVPRAEVVSGWDLANWQPKPAQRAAPTGSVYWLQDLVADPDQLRKLAAAGLWSTDGDNPHRRAEGFNRFTFAAY